MMRMPDGGVIDTMMSIPPEPGDMSWLEALRPLLRDEESLSAFKFPAEYMFKNLPAARFAGDALSAVLHEMDRFGVERSMIGLSFGNERATSALRDHPDRFFGSFEVDPNQGRDGVRSLHRAVDELGVRAATAFPAGTFPQVPADDARWYPLYEACIDLDVPICICLGVPGPRVPAAPQAVMLIDEVCYRFPELTIVTRHGCEPWTELAVKLLLKWPNLYYSTSAFAPKYYPQTIVDFANTRGASKVMYAGYFPMGLSLERIFKDMQDVPFRDHVWPKFLRENAIMVFKL
jgi:predicted TIM-barrel fold metal-dependent hydrolase